VQVERFERRRYIDDCDSGVQLRRRIQALESLLAAYRSGEIQEKE
jgi:fructose-1,6-bisphosphatase